MWHWHTCAKGSEVFTSFRTNIVKQFNNDTTSCQKQHKLTVKDHILLHSQTKTVSQVCDFFNPICCHPWKANSNISVEAVNFYGFSSVCRNLKSFSSLDEAVLHSQGFCPFVKIKFKNFSRTFKDHNEEYISEGVKIEAPRTWGSWGGLSPGVVRGGAPAENAF